MSPLRFAPSHRPIFAAIPVLLIAALANAAEEVVKSPDGNLALKLLTRDGTLHYAVSVAGREVIVPTPIAISIDGLAAPAAEAFAKVERREVNETIPMEVPTFASRIKVRANSMTVALGNGLALDARAYDDLVAFRWVCDKRGPLQVTGEKFGYRFASDHGMFYPVPNGTKFVSHQENTFLRKRISETRGLETGPAPFLVDLGGGTYLLGTDVNVSGYPGLHI
jgi:alpha-glucosidase